jgi:hypothetical protein
LLHFLYCLFWLLSFLPYSYVILNSCYQLQSTYQFLSRSSCVILNQVDEASVILCGKLLSSDSFSCFVGLDPSNQYHSLIWWTTPILTSQPVSANWLPRLLVPKMKSGSQPVSANWLHDSRN